MKYTVLVAQTAEDLVTKVNQHIASGWTPLGGLSLGMVPGALYFCQAMVSS